MKKKSYIAVFFTLVTVIIILHNSMYPIAQSDLQSGFVLRALNRLFSGVGYGIAFTQYAVRKLAHFAEYFFFGLVLTAAVRIIRKNPHGAFFFELFLFLAVPVLDETIQLAYQGRNSSILDVLIDFAGGMAGMGICGLVLLLRSDRRRPRHAEERRKGP